MRSSAGCAVMLLVLLPAGLAQKPPAPTPQPNPQPPPSTGRPTTPLDPDTRPLVMNSERVMYIFGSVATNDGTPIPTNVIVERVCNARVRQQVYADNRGSFTMELGTPAATAIDSTMESDSRESNWSKNDGIMGVPRRNLNNCEVRASIAGFRSRSVDLMAITPSLSRMDVGSIVLERNVKVRGATLNAAPYKAPDKARRAYVKGTEAMQHGKLTEAQRYFEQAVKLYPKYASAWFGLGSVLRSEKDTEGARKAFLQSTSLDNKFLPPYLSLASIAFDEKNWKEVLGLTRYILSFDQLNYARISGYVLDLDTVDYSEAYFYDAAANFQLNRIDEAEKSGLQAARLDLRPRFPQVHLLLADIFTRKNDSNRAIDELHVFLTSVPRGRNADLARERLASLQAHAEAPPAHQ